MGVSSAVSAAVSAAVSELVSAAVSAQLSRALLSLEAPPLLWAPAKRKLFQIGDPLKIRPLCHESRKNKKHPRRESTKIARHFVNSSKWRAGRNHKRKNNLVWGNMREKKKGKFFIEHLFRFGTFLYTMKLDRLYAEWTRYVSFHLLFR